MKFSRKDAKTPSISVFSFCLLRFGGIGCRSCLSHFHYQVVRFYGRDVNGKMGIFADFCKALVIRDLHSLLAP